LTRGGYDWIHFNTFFLEKYCDFKKLNIYGLFLEGTSRGAREDEM
jgi:hypothetical protein